MANNPTTDPHAAHPSESSEGNGRAASAANGEHADTERVDVAARQNGRHAADHEPHGEPPQQHDEIGSPPEPPRPGKFALLVLVACTVAILVGLFLVGLLPRLHDDMILAQDAERIKLELPRVAVTTPRQSAPTVEVQLPGDAEALEETTVYPRTSGYLKQWLVDIGDEVKSGQLLAVIDTPDVDQALDKAKATLAQLKASEITAESDLKLAETTLVRYESLDRDNAVSKLELDQRRSAAETTRAALAAAKANVVGGQADVDRLTTLQQFSRVYAPFDGTITARNIEVGQLLTNGNGSAQSLFHIAKTNPVRVFVNVPQVYSVGVKIGLSADIFVRGMSGRKFVGIVTRTAKAIDPATRTLRTQIDVPNPNHAILTVSYVHVRLNIARDNPPLLIPAAALVYNAQGTQVAVLDESQRVHFQPVEVEGDFGTDVGISGGLKLTDRIIANPGARLTDGGQVQIDQGSGSEKTETPNPGG
jgi:RND family efflux transporter MFP subunit